MKYLELVNNFTSEQHGVVARYQLAKSGCSDSAIRSMVQHGFLRRLEHGVYALKGSAQTNGQNIARSVLCCGPEAMLSHVSLLSYFGVIDINSLRNNNLVHVLLPRPTYHVRNIVFHRSIKIPVIDRAYPTWGIAHVCIERALIDSVSLLSQAQLDYAIQFSIDKKLTTPKRIDQTCVRTPSGPGRSIGKFRQVFDHYLLPQSNTRGIESVLEARTWKVLMSIRKDFERQFSVLAQGNSYRLDFAIPSLKIAIEVDGFSYHKNRTVFDNDRTRQNALIAAGWKIVRITASMSDYEIFAAVQAVL